MAYSRRDAGPAFFQGASNVNASRGVFNSIGRDQYNYNSYNNAMNEEMVVRRSFHQINPIVVEFFILIG
jgi:hypothetical protein